MDKGSFLAKCTRLVSFTLQNHKFERKTPIKAYFCVFLFLIFVYGGGEMGKYFMSTFL